MINELVRPTIEEKPYERQGIVAMNSAIKTPLKCSWICHNDTDYCKENHVKILNNYFEYTDPIYFGIIHSLKSVGNYSLANIIFLVILIPLIMYLLLIKSINIQDQIRDFNKAKE